MRAFDMFAEALWEYYERGRTVLYTEQENGSQSREDISWYLSSYSEFPSYEKDALKFARGRVLDVGCGAGRHALYLQRRGLEVTAIDVSPRIVELAKVRGVKDVRVGNACGTLDLRGAFDTVVLFGNNLGMCGTVRGFSSMLKELAPITAPNARIIGTTRLPGMRARYTRRDENRGELCQLRIRLRNRHTASSWLKLLLLSPEGLVKLADQAGWVLEYVFGDDWEQGYAAVLKKGSGKKRTLRRKD